jgi:hypothetical protein
MALDRNPLVTRLGSNYTTLETTQVVEKMVARGGMERWLRQLALRASVAAAQLG